MEYINYFETIRYSVKRIEDYAKENNQNFKLLLNQVITHIRENTIFNNQSGFDNNFNLYVSKYF